MPTRRSRKVQESNPMVWEGSGGNPCGLGVFGRPTWRLGEVERPTRRYGSCLEAHPEVRERFSGPPGCLGGAGGPPGGPV